MHRDQMETESENRMPNSDPSSDSQKIEALKSKIAKEEPQGSSGITINGRNDQQSAYDEEKLLKSISKLSHGLDIDTEALKSIVSKVKNGLALNTSYKELTQLVIDLCSSSITLYPDLSLLAGRIAISDLHKSTKSSFSAYAEQIHEHNNQIYPDNMITFIRDNADKIDQAIDFELDYTYNYFSIRTLMLSYLLHINDEVVERPQYLNMRVALAINYPDIDAAIKSYKIFSQKFYTHATPTLSSAGKIDCQMASCLLLSMDDDSIEGIFKTLRDVAILSKFSAGIGLSISNIRSCGAIMKRTGKKSQGIIPMCKVYADTALYVNQGGNNRPGAVALYLEPWHGDILDFLLLRKNQGCEERRARNIFTALWIPDIFMRRVESGADWTLMSQDTCPGLVDAYGKEFDELYTRYEREGKGMRTVKAREVWDAILESQIETGTPYMCYKDSVNSKSNQKNIGTIHSSNLCAEIVEYSSKDQIAVCNLASLVLPNFVDKSSKKFDFDKLFEIVQIATMNLDKTIDANFYPIDIAKSSNAQNRPIGLGVQGLADVFMLLDLSFDCDEARILNRQIFETIYFAAVTASCELARLHGPYKNYEGSPASQGLLSYDLWNDVPKFDKWDWISLKKKVAKYGLRNSLLTTCMPTSSTSNIMNCNECIEPITSNIYIRRVLSGEFQLVNKYLVHELKSLGLWDKKMKNKIIQENGSIQSIVSIPSKIREKYRTVWEIPQKSLIDMAADRAPFIDQSQSLNIFIANPSHQQMTSMHFYGWKKGLKTGMYYLRTKPAVNAIKFTLNESSTKSGEAKCSDDHSASNLALKRNLSADQLSKAYLCQLENPEGCMMCGS